MIGHSIIFPAHNRPRQLSESESPLDAPASPIATEESPDATSSSPAQEDDHVMTTLPPAPATTEIEEPQSSSVPEQQQSTPSDTTPASAVSDSSLPPPSSTQTGEPSSSPSFPTTTSPASASSSSLVSDAGSSPSSPTVSIAPSETSDLPPQSSTPNTPSNSIPPTPPEPSATSQTPDDPTSSTSFAPSHTPQTIPQSSFSPEPSTPPPNQDTEIGENPLSSLVPGPSSEPTSRPQNSESTSRPQPTPVSSFPPQQPSPPTTVTSDDAETVVPPPATLPPSSQSEVIHEPSASPTSLAPPSSQSTPSTSVFVNEPSSPNPTLSVPSHVIPSASPNSDNRPIPTVADPAETRSSRPEGDNDSPSIPSATQQDDDDALRATDAPVRPVDPTDSDVEVLPSATPVAQQNPTNVATNPVVITTQVGNEFTVLTIPPHAIVTATQTTDTSFIFLFTGDVSRSLDVHLAVEATGDSSNGKDGGLPFGFVTQGGGTRTLALPTGSQPAGDGGNGGGSNDSGSPPNLLAIILGSVLGFLFLLLLLVCVVWRRRRSSGRGLLTGPSHQRLGESPFVFRDGAQSPLRRRADNAVDNASLWNRSSGFQSIESEPGWTSWNPVSQSDVPSPGPNVPFVISSHGTIRSPSPQTVNPFVPVGYRSRSPSPPVSPFVFSSQGTIRSSSPVPSTSTVRPESLIDWGSESSVHFASNSGSNTPRASTLRNSQRDTFMSFGSDTTATAYMSGKGDLEIGKVEMVNHFRPFSKVPAVAQPTIFSTSREDLTRTRNPFE